jgi:hypothetical protein
MVPNLLNRKASDVAAACAGLIIASSGAVFAPSSAHAYSATDFLRDNWGRIVSHAYSPFHTQVFMTNLSWQETQSVINQHRSRAGGVLHNRCTTKIANVYMGGLPSWIRNSLWTLSYPLVVMRVENSQANCFMRFENGDAQRFIRSRGW